MTKIAKKKIRYRRVRCLECNRIVGADQKIKEIEKCFSCHKKKKGSKGNGKIRTVEEAFKRTNKGPAEDLPEKYREYVFKSGWERGFARYLTYKKQNWEYETQKCTFPFKNVKRSPFIYICDFYSADEDLYYEVKGLFLPKDRSKLRRLKSQYPQVFKKLYMVCSKSNKSIITFCAKYNIPFLYIEELKNETKDIISWS
jgi:hypothetical protein